jgi:hypothetical protein
MMIEKEIREMEKTVRKNSKWRRFQQWMCAISIFILFIICMYNLNRM